MLATATRPALFVATDLDCFEAVAPDRDPCPDVVREGRAYRRLDPAYFAWIWQMMATARRAAAEGVVDRAEFEGSRHAANRSVYLWAVKHLDRPSLIRAINDFDPARYTPPASAGGVKPARRKGGGRGEDVEAEGLATEIAGTWDAGAGTLRLAGLPYAFLPWEPALGRVFDRGFAFDCETTAIVGHETPTLVIAAVYGDTDRGFFLMPDALEAFFREHRGLSMAIHNASFDMDVIHGHAPGLGIYDWVDEDRVWDTRLLHRGYRLGTAGDTASWKGQSSLETCAREHLGYHIPKDVKDSRGDDVRTSYGRWLGRPLADVEEVYLTYLATDAVVGLLLFRTLYEKLVGMLSAAGNTWGFVRQDWLAACVRRWGPQTHHLKLQADIVLRDVTRRGVLIDPPNRDEAREGVRQVIEENRAVLAREYDYHSGQSGSDGRLREIIEALDREVDDLELEKTPTGKYRATKDVIEELTEYSPFFGHLNDYRVASKLRSTYLDKMGEGQGETILHPSYDVLKATGRTSSFGEINAQNLPKGDGRVRRCMVTRRGKVNIDLDYKGVELVGLSQACQSQFDLPSRMAEAINAGKDLHRLVAAQMFQVAEAGVDEDQRFRAKAVNFGLPGGMGVPRFRAYLKTGIKRSNLAPERKAELDAWATPENCQEAVDAWFAAFPEMRTFLEKDDGLLPGLASFFDLTPENYALFTGRPAGGPGYREPAAWLGGMFCKVLKADDGPPTTRGGDEYGDDQVAFFWTMLERKIDLLPNKARTLVRRRQAGYVLFQEVRNHVSRAGVFTLTGRLRARATYCARHNTVFQGLAADGANRALWLIWRAGYTIANFVHDQLVIEIDADQDLRPHIARLKELMIRGMREVVPDVLVDVDWIVSTSWAKQDKVELDAAGRPTL
jgi:DNA polymerase I-like protein with 3'-5' exonuclease and polymerase domains